MIFCGELTTDSEILILLSSNVDPKNAKKKEKNNYAHAALALVDHTCVVVSNGITIS